MTHEYHATVERERQDVAFFALFMSPLDSAAAYPLMTQSGHRESAEG